MAVLPSSTKAHSSVAFQSGEVELVRVGVGGREAEREAVCVGDTVRDLVVVAVAVNDAEEPRLRERVKDAVREGVLLGVGMIHCISTCRYWYRSGHRFSLLKLPELTDSVQEELPRGHRAATTVLLEG